MKNLVRVEKSISNKRIPYNLEGSELFKYVSNNIISGMLIIIFIFMAFVAFVQSAIILFCVVACVVTWLIINRILLYKLLKVSCSRTRFVRSDLVNIICENVGNKGIKREYENLIVCEKLSGAVSFGKLTTVIIDNDDIYINIQTLIRGGIASPYHGFINYLKAQGIKKQISLLCKSNSQPAATSS